MTNRTRRALLAPLTLLAMPVVTGAVVAAGGPFELTTAPLVAAQATAATDQFYALASIQTSTLDRGEVVLKLTASGPIAYRIVEDDVNTTSPPTASVPATLHLKLYGIHASTIGSSVATEVGSVQLTPDGHGNLDAILQPAGPFAAQPLHVTSGRRANELEVRVAADPAH